MSDTQDLRRKLAELRADCRSYEITIQRIADADNHFEAEVARLTAALTAIKLECHPDDEAFCDPPKHRKMCFAIASDALAAQAELPSRHFSAGPGALDDSAFLRWIAGRLQYVHGEPAHHDYMRRLRSIAEGRSHNAMPAERETEHLGTVAL